MSPKDANRTPLLFGLPLNWGTQLTIASVGAGLFWWLQDKWIDGRRFPAVNSVGARLWQTAPALVSMALTIFCLTWVAALLIQASIFANPSKQTAPASGTLERTGRSPFARRLLAFILFTVVVAAFDGVSTTFAYTRFPSVAPTITAIAGIIALAAVIIGTPVLIRGKGAEKDVIYPAVAERTEMRRYGPPKWWIQSARWLPTAIFLGIFFAPFQMIRMEWRLVALVLVLLWPLGVHRLKIWIYEQSRKGDPERALRLNRSCAWIPGYGVSFEGLILFDAGRYVEALDFLKPLAFDGEGRPRLTSLELYLYSVALINNDRLAEAELLLEQAVRVTGRPTKSLEMALASCLLTQRKDAERACALIEEAMSTPEVRITGYGRVSEHALRLAHYVWALAAAGRKSESLAQIEKASSASADLKNSDKAAVEYFIGEAWEAMSNVAKSRSAYETSISLRPEGVTAVSASKGLARLKLL